jgi:hydrogenase maturation factor
VLELDGSGLALCEDEHGQRTDIEVALVGSIAPGDGVLAHAGTAIAKLEPEAVA